jgi:hypothetical protein
MEKNKFIEMLIRNREVLLNLLVGVSQDAVLWKPDPKKWCLLEIICHLVDEEKEDFRARLKKTLEDPDTPFDPIDPEQWAVERNYIKQDCDKKLREFLYERDKSISWLYSLTSPNWDNTTNDPAAGPMSAKKILVNWIAHDYLHIRQILHLKYQFLKVSNNNMNLSYAGKW